MVAQGCIVKLQQSKVYAMFSMAVDRTAPLLQHTARRAHKPATWVLGFDRNTYLAVVNHSGRHCATITIKFPSTLLLEKR